MKKGIVYVNKKGKVLKQEETFSASKEDIADEN